MRSGSFDVVGSTSCDAVLRGLAVEGIERGKRIDAPPCPPTTSRAWRRTIPKRIAPKCSASFGKVFRRSSTPKRLRHASSPIVASCCHAKVYAISRTSIRAAAEGRLRTGDRPSRPRPRDRRCRSRVALQESRGHGCGGGGSLAPVPPARGRAHGPPAEDDAVRGRRRRYPSRQPAERGAGETARRATKLLAPHSRSAR
jgi:hypothetical protein